MQVGGNRWKVDVNSRKDAELLLAAVNLPGGIQVKQLPNIVFCSNLVLLVLT